LVKDRIVICRVLHSLASFAAQVDLSKGQQSETVNSIIDLLKVGCGYPALLVRSTATAGLTSIAKNQKLTAATRSHLAQALSRVASDNPTDPLLDVKLVGAYAALRDATAPPPKTAQKGNTKDNTKDTGNTNNTGGKNSVALTGGGTAPADTTAGEPPGGVTPRAAD
jgi:hypothetical protein